MTEQQMVAALKSVGACFATSTAKFISPNDPYGSKPAYHIHPNSEYPHEKDIVRVYSQKQLVDWVRTMKAVARMTNEQAYDLQEAYKARWETAG